MYLQLALSDYAGNWWAFASSPFALLDFSLIIIIFSYYYLFNFNEWEGDGGGRLFEAGCLLTFSAFTMGAYSMWALI